jgi:hypothetical protein
VFEDLEGRTDAITSAQRLILQDINDGPFKTSTGLASIGALVSQNGSATKTYNAQQLSTNDQPLVTASKQFTAAGILVAALALSLTTTSSLTPTAGRTSTFTATATQAGTVVPLPGITVTFRVGGNVECTVVTGANGFATCTYTWGASGTFTVTADGIDLSGGIVTAQQTLTFTVGPTLTAQVNGQAVPSGVTVLVSDAQAVLSAHMAYICVDRPTASVRASPPAPPCWGIGLCVDG